MVVRPGHPDPVDHAARIRLLLGELGDEIAALISGPPGVEPEPVYNLRQVGELLQQSASTINRWRRAGELHTLPYRGKPVVTAAELRRFLAARDGAGEAGR